MQHLLINWIVALYRNHPRPRLFLFLFLCLSYWLAPGCRVWSCLITIDALFSQTYKLNVLHLQCCFTMMTAHKISISLICYGLHSRHIFFFWFCRRMLPLRNTCCTCGTTLCPKQRPRMSSSWPTAMEGCLSLNWWVFSFSAYPSYLPPTKRHMDANRAILSAQSQTLVLEKLHTTLTQSETLWSNF